jgi:hypothetical protein
MQTHIAPPQLNPVAMARPRDTSKKMAVVCTCPPPDSQIVRRDKIACRAHYEGIVSQLQQEAAAHGHA